MTEYEDLLILPDIFIKRHIHLNKCYYAISPYWNKEMFNFSIFCLKDRYNNINPLYVGVKDSLFTRRFKDILQILEEERGQ